MAEESLKIIPYGHRVKIVKRIREINEEVRPVQRNEYEELPEIEDNRSNFNNGDITDINAYEEEQRRLFQQAVSEFRGGKGDIVIEDQSRDNVIGDRKVNVIYILYSLLHFYKMLGRIFLILIVSLIVKRKEQDRRNFYQLIQIRRLVGLAINIYSSISRGI